MIFCKDVDLLYWEPDVLRDAAFASQTLNAGTGDLAGTSFERTSGIAFTDAGIEPGHVLALAGSGGTGCYAITAVLDADHLRVSLLYAELFPDDDDTPEPAPLAHASATGIAYAVRTFWAQRKTISDLLLQSVGVVPGTAEAQTASVLNPAALRRACALGTLQMIYSAIAAAAPEPAAYTLRADLYERLYRRALHRAQVDLDLDGDGRPDTGRSPGLIRLTRA